LPDPSSSGRFVRDLLALHPAPKPASGTAPAHRQAAPASQPAPASEAFAVLRHARRIWAVAAIHAEIDRLHDAHQELAARLLPAVRLVFLGNMVGHGAATVATLDEVLAFRRDYLCLPGAEPDDIVYMRGAQEEMCRKLLQIQI